MYKLTKLDKFNIRKLLELRESSITEKDIDNFLSFDNEKIAYYIDDILQVWEEESQWIGGIKGKEKKLFDYCENLIEKLVSGNDDEEESNITNDDLINIHPDIYAHIKKLFNDGHYANAVEEAYKITREKLIELTGEEKATNAFNKNNYEIIFGKEPETQVEENFCEGVKFLHMAIQKFRNEKSHTPAKKLDKNKAIHYIYLASLALRLLDKKK